LCCYSQCERSCSSCVVIANDYDNHYSIFVVNFQGYEDLLRHKADNEVNNREAYVVRDGKVAQCKSMDIKV